MPVGGVAVTAVERHLGHLIHNLPYLHYIWAGVDASAAAYTLPESWAGDMGFAEVTLAPSIL